MRDRLVRPDAQISRWSLDFLTADQMASNGLFHGTKDDRSSRAEFFPTGSGLTRAPPCSLLTPFLLLAFGKPAVRKNVLRRCHARVLEVAYVLFSKKELDISHP